MGNAIPSGTIVIEWKIILSEYLLSPTIINLKRTDALNRLRIRKYIQ